MSDVEGLSDEEVFFGRLTLKEVKKHIFFKDRYRQTVGCPNEGVAKAAIESDPNKSIKIIETHSEPNLNSGKEEIESQKLVSNASSPNLQGSDIEDSFLKIEKLVSDMCASPNKSHEQLNNTLEVVEYILNHGPNSNNVKTETDKNILTPNKIIENMNHDIPDLLLHTPGKPLPEEFIKENNSNYFTPTKKQETLSKNILATPSSQSIKKTPVFKTPANPVSNKKQPLSSTKKTPGRSNAYQHIASPIASYIKNCPVVPLVKDVKPKKPLPGPSSIPKFTKSNVLKPSSFDNIQLPSVAYKSAKKTKVFNVPEESRLPQSHWAKKVSSSLPKPVIMKHNHREMKYSRTPKGMQDDSFADLTLQQAEVSVCTQKSAFKMK